MCGIAGIVDYSQLGNSQPILRRMCDAIAHRGPDGEGYFVEGPAALGHRRLAILDLSPAAHQPMASVSGRYYLTYNGEIYNFQTLRLELEALGHKFHSFSDTEVLLASYVEWGERCLSKLNGMFAFAIWDKQKQELFLARDRYGIKPLYTSQNSGLFLFGSEIKALKEHPLWRGELDHSGLMEYMSFQNIFSQRTLYKGVEMFPAGHWGVYSKERGLRTQLYWDYNFQDTIQYDEFEMQEELNRLFVQAVNRQLVSDVEVGSFLSGGMDSGSITAVASRSLQNMKTFTVGFDLSSASGMELAFDERRTAEAMSYQFRTEQYEMVLKAGDMERALAPLSHHLEEPRVGQSYPNYYAAQLASKFCKVVLAGTGGDELFAGYPWRYYSAIPSENSTHYLNQYYKTWNRLLSEDEQKKVFGPIAAKVEDTSPFEIFKNVYPKQMHDQQSWSPGEYVNWSLYLEAKTFLHGLLVVDDKLSMAHSLETRVPFLDNDLVDFAMKLPASLKLGDFNKTMEGLNSSKRSFSKTSDGKMALRKAMARHIPKSIADAKKQGFSAPDASWFKGESIDFVRRRLLNKNSPLYEIFDQKAVQNIVEAHTSGDQNRRLVVWSFLNLDQFLKNF